MTSGYDGPDPTDDKIPEPDEDKWTLPLLEHMNDDDGTILCRLCINGKPTGLVRLPSMDHVKWLRQKIQTTTES